MSYSEILLAPGSGRPVTRSLVDKLGASVDFTVGTWRADLRIIEYPGVDSPLFATLSTSTVPAGVLQWLTLEDGAVTINPDPAVTDGWDFYKYHYELFIQGPNPESKVERVGHGPFKLSR